MNHRVFYPRYKKPYRRQPSLPDHRPQVVSKRLFQRLNRGKTVWCKGSMQNLDLAHCHKQACSLPIQIGDTVIMSGRYYYHQHCYESLFLECPEPTEEELKETTINDETPT